MTRAYGAVEDYEDGQLVVALGDRDLVREALTGLGVTAKNMDEDGRLGLALLALPDLASGADLLRRDRDLVGQAIKAKWGGDSPPEGAKLSDLDLVLRKLRVNFSRDYAGWIPEIGKNRLISPVRGMPYVSGCAEGDPGQLGLDDPSPGLTSGQPQGWPQRRPTKPGRNVQVGLLDTRLYPHPWLAGGYLASGTDLVRVPATGGAFDALAGHATFIAGLILRQAPGASLVVRSALEGSALGKTWDVAKKMAEFAGSGVDILNLSFGCYTDDGQPPLVLAKAVSLVSPQILLVAAAGNHGNIEDLWKEVPPPPVWTKHLKNTTPVWPAAFAEVTAVGANDGNGVVADFSPKAPWVDVTAPGVDVGSIYFNGKVRLTSGNPPVQAFQGAASWRGTSFAAATVSGAVAAKIRAGRPAPQALDTVLRDPGQSGIVKFELPKT